MRVESLPPMRQDACCPGSASPTLRSGEGCVFKNPAVTGKWPRGFTHLRTGGAVKPTRRRLISPPANMQALGRVKRRRDCAEIISIVRLTKVQLSIALR